MCLVYARSGWAPEGEGGALALTSIHGDLAPPPPRVSMPRWSSGGSPAARQARSLLRGHAHCLRSSSRQCAKEKSQCSHARDARGGTHPVPCSTQPTHKTGGLSSGTFDGTKSRDRPCHFGSPHFVFTQAALPYAVPASPARVPEHRSPLLTVTTWHCVEGAGRWVCLAGWPRGGRAGPACGGTCGPSASSGPRPTAGERGAHAHASEWGAHARLCVRMCVRARACVSVRAHRDTRAFVNGCSSLQGPQPLPEGGPRARPATRDGGTAAHTGRGREDRPGRGPAQPQEREGRHVVFR